MVLLNNQYIYNRYWLYQRGQVSSWKEEFKRDNLRAVRLLQNPDKSVELIQLVMRRLYQMRNQLIHGGATYKSSVNRDQVRDSANLLGRLIPLIVEIMLDNPKMLGVIFIIPLLILKRMLRRIKTNPPNAVAF